MSLSTCGNNSSNNNSENESNNRIDLEELRDNIGKVITVFTASGGCTGRGFTGLLVRVERDFIRLITSIPSAPCHPFGIRSGNLFDDGCECRRRFGTVLIIPIRQIVCFAFNEV